MELRLTSCNCQKCKCQFARSGQIWEFYICPSKCRPPSLHSAARGGCPPPALLAATGFIITIMLPTRGQTTGNITLCRLLQYDTLYDTAVVFDMVDMKNALVWNETKSRLGSRDTHKTTEVHWHCKMQIGQRRCDLQPDPVTFMINPTDIFLSLLSASPLKV